MESLLSRAFHFSVVLEPAAYAVARWRISIPSRENSARSSFKRQEVMSWGAPFCTLTMM
jgi:hypothetical protein